MSPIGWFAQFLFLTAIQIGLNLLSRLLEPKRKRDKPRPFESPVASSGAPLGKGFGIFEVQPNVVLVHEPSLEESDEGGTTVTRYYAKLQLMCGWGPISILYDIVSDDRSIRTQRPGKRQSIDGLDPNVIYPALPFDFDANPNAGVEFSINARQIYGGATEGGGLQGLLMFRPGYSDQPIDPLIAEVLGEFASAYPWGAYARLGAESGRESGLSVNGGNQQGDLFYLTANSPTPNTMSFIVGAYPKLLLGQNERIGLNANAAEMLFEIYTDRKWGGRKPTSRFDIPQWVIKTQQIRDEGLGLSIPQDSPRSLDDTVEDILSHIDGGIVEDPTTGLLQLKLARADYTVDGLLEINKTNTENFRRGKPLLPRTLNDIQVRYRRFYGGITGEVIGETVTEEIRAKAVDSGPPYHFMVGGAGSFNSIIDGVYAYTYKSAGDSFIEGSTHAYSQRGSDPPVELVLGTEYTVNLDSGLWHIFEGPNVRAAYSNNPADPGWFAGDKLTISYASNPKYTAFVDDVATSQNLANQQSVGRQQAESYDYTYYTNPINAQWKADRLRATLSRSIDTFSWEGRRDQSGLTPWDVVTVLEPEWGITEPIAIRITKVSYGTRIDPKLTIEGVKDIWGEEILLSTAEFGGGGQPGQPAAPAMGIGCGTGGVDVARIDLFPTDFIYAVEVWEADDEVGTNAVLVATITAGTDPMFYDGTVGKFYSARQISQYTTPGPFTSWITCADVVGPPVDPMCVLPTYTFVADDLTGLITVQITDPQNRVHLDDMSSVVEFRSRSGNGNWGAWEVITAPYCYSVILSATETSRIEWRITYLACDDGSATYQDGYDFIPSVPPPPPPPEPQPLFQIEIPVVLHAGGPTPIGIDEVELPVDDATIPLTAWKATENKTPLTKAKSCYIAASLVKADLPLGSYLVIRGHVPGETGVWQSLGPDDTPRIPLDHVSLLAMDAEATVAGDFPVAVAGAWADIREEFLSAPLHIRADLVGVSGTVLQEIIIPYLCVWFSIREGIAAPPVEPPETTEPPDDDPGSCDVPTVLDPLDYASVGALDAEWPVT